MNRIDLAFINAAKEKRKVFVAYIGSGDPDIETTLDIIKTFDKCGVDIIELGIPFSDPIGDGPVNQASSERALINKTSLNDVFNIIKQFRKKATTPIVIFSYFNPILQYGFKNFSKDAKKCGVDGVLIVDAPFDMCKELRIILESYNIYMIQLIAPNSESKRTEEIINVSKGFIYYISSLGVTGIRKKFTINLKHIEDIKNKTSTPVCIGFGISTPLDAKKISKYADGVIIGSALVKIIEKNLTDKNLMLKEITSFSKQTIKSLKNN